MSGNTVEKTEENLFEVGDAAPDFEMQTDAGETVTLASFAGKKLVLYFYPKDDTPGCTIEAKDFRDNRDKFKVLDTEILGVSKDSIKSHEKFKEKHFLTHSLGSDEGGSVCENYGVWVEKDMYGKKYMGIQRATFLIDEKGNFAAIWRKVSVKGHVEEVLAAAKK